MISLLIWIVLLPAQWLITAWAIAGAARAAGSPRGRLRVGLLMVLLLTAIGIAFTVVERRVSASSPAKVWTIAIVLLVMQLLAAFEIFRRGFQLSARRTLAPVGAYVAMALASIGLAIGVIRPWVTHAFVIPSRSMEPTLNPGDRFLVNKLIRPRRWDLVAYQARDEHESVYVKRLIALPGERLRFENGDIYVNDQRADMPAVLAGRCRARPGDPPPSQGRYADRQTITLGSNEFFFIGDDPEISADSRFHGPSDASALVGVADLIYWPPGKMRIIR